VDLRAYHHQFTLSLSPELTDFYERDWWGALPVSDALKRGASVDTRCSPGLRAGGSDARSRESFVEEVEQNGNAQTEAPPKLTRTAMSSGNSPQCAATKPRGASERITPNDGDQLPVRQGQRDGSTGPPGGGYQRTRARRTGRDEELGRARSRDVGSSSVSRPRSKQRQVDARRASFSMGAALSRLSRRGAPCNNTGTGTGSRV
jgi:hypothetical protein